MSRINTNIPAMVAQGRLLTNQNDLNIRLERLATGLRINRGKDDPAGLIISERLRKEIRGIEQAVSNSQRVINILSTAEAALNEVSALLLDVRSLIQTSANTGGLSDGEIEANQQEIDAILASVDRIANTTTFAGRKLLNGEQEYLLSAVDTNNLASVQLHSVRLPSNSARSFRLQVTQSAQTAELAFTGATTSATTVELRGSLGSEILGFAAGTATSAVAASINNLTSVTGVSATLSGTSLRLNSTEYGSDQLVSVKALSGNFFAPTTGTTLVDLGQDVAALINGQATLGKGLKVIARTNSLDAEIFLTSTFAQQTVSSTTMNVNGGGAVYQIGADVSVNGQVYAAIPSVTTGNLGNAVVGFLNTIRSGSVNSVIGGNFIAAEEIITTAVNQIAGLRGRLGSIQKDQVETNINSQQIALENVKASESVIRDADIAVEVAALTRAQILIQSTQTTLQIANSQPQNVLSLLGG